MDPIREPSSPCQAPPGHWDEDTMPLRIRTLGEVLSHIYDFNFHHALYLPKVETYRPDTPCIVGDDEAHRRCVEYGFPNWLNVAVVSDTCDSVQPRTDEALVAAFDADCREGRWLGRMMNYRQTRWEDEQEPVCRAHGVSLVPCPRVSKVGIALNVKEGLLPVNGMRVRPVGDTSGWYIWAGAEMSEAPDFFVPLHAEHLEQWCPQIIRFLGLPPGWRFLVAGEHEDVWEDKELLTS
jgi:hypothetical protein